MGALASDTQDGSGESGDRSGAPALGPSAEAVEGAVALTPLMARVDVAVAAILALVAATITIAMPKLIASGGIDTERDFATMSSALIPRMAFGALTILAIIALVPAIQAVRSGSGQPRPDEIGRLRRAGIAALIAIVYAASVTTLGYILSTMLMTAAMAWYLGLRNPLMFIPGVIIIPVTIRFVFERLLLISLPRSSIESIGVVEDAVLRYFSQLLLS
jgi:Tripartite tricarboxylate transporter TctB family